MPIYEKLDSESRYLKDIHILVTKHFDEEGLKTICFNLGVVFEDLPSKGRTNKARELVLELNRAGRIDELKNEVLEKRPHISWPNKPHSSPIERSLARNSRIKFIPPLIALSAVVILLIIQSIGIRPNSDQSTRSAQTKIAENTQTSIAKNTVNAESNIEESRIAATQTVFAQETREAKDDDDDGLSNKEESNFGTEPDNPDTDGDGLTDYQELKIYSTNPLDIDSDDDLFVDGEEINYGCTSPNNEDSDRDGVLDGLDSAPCATPTILQTETRPPTVTILPVATSPITILTELVSVQADYQEGLGRDTCGSAINYLPGNLLDGLNETAWRIPGNGVGVEIHFDFEQIVYLTTIQITPGYDKVDPCDETLKWCPINRIPKELRLVGSNNVSIQLELEDKCSLQSFDIGPLETEFLNIEILSSYDAHNTSYYKNGESFTAISEIEFLGRGLP